MKQLAAFLILQTLLATALAAGRTDCSTPSTHGPLLQSLPTDVNGWNYASPYGDNVVVQGRLRAIDGAHGHRSFLVHVYQVSIFAPLTRTSESEVHI